MLPTPDQGEIATTGETPTTSETMDSGTMDITTPKQSTEEAAMATTDDLNRVPEDTISDLDPNRLTTLIAVGSIESRATVAVAVSVPVVVLIALVTVGVVLALCVGKRWKKKAEFVNTTYEGY